MNKRMLQQAQQMQAKLARIQQEIAEARTEATSGGGAVKAVVLGGTKLESLTISAEAVQAGDAEMLQDLVMAAINEAMDMAQAEASKKMAAVTGGLNIPGLF